jgi:hypothetical protein
VLFAVKGGLALLAVLSLVAGCGGDAPSPQQSGFDHGWTRLPLPPQLTEQAAPLWTGSEFITWGGCLDVPSTPQCQATANGYALRATDDVWQRIPTAPLVGTGARAVWTGSEAVFLLPGRPLLACCVPAPASIRQPTGAAYDPATRAWRVLPPAPTPIYADGVQVWTGREIVVWGGGGRNVSKVNPDSGAAYNPETDAWRRVAPAPLALNLASASWTGKEVLVFGSLLDARNGATTRTSVGAAYNPATDTWRTMPPSTLSAQATSAVWVGGGMLAWDYETHWQVYDPVTNRWGERRKMPIDFSECYPQTVVAGGRAYAFFCGQAAIYDPMVGRWRRFASGPLGPTHPFPRPSEVSKWSDAVLTPAGDGVVVTFRSLARPFVSGYWAYRP